MTDDKVKEAVETVARAICVKMGQEPDDSAPTGMICGPNNEPLPWWCFYEEQAEAAVLALQAERDKLEQAWLEAEGKHSDEQHRADTLEAKLTALVEALTKSNDALSALKKLVAATPSLQGREHIDLGIQVNNAIDAGAQALANHSAPEAEQIAEAWNDLAPGHRFGRRLTADAVETLERGTLLRFHSDDPWFDHSGDMPKHGEIVWFTGNVGRAFPLVGDHLEVQALNGRIYPGGGWVFRLFQFVAPPSTPTSAPVEDVGGLVTLRSCPPGLFRFGGALGFRTEYQTEVNGQWWPEAFCLDSGEFFWGGAKTHQDAELMVQPAALIQPERSDPPPPRP